MQANVALEILGRHQDNVVRILAEARRSLRLSDASNLSAMALLRWELMRALREYQLFKHTEIFDPLILAGRQPRMSAAGVLKARCLEVAAAYGEHVRRWSLEGPTSAWDEYREDTIAMIDRIERHLATEAREVRMALFGVERTRRA